MGFRKQLILITMSILFHLSATTANGQDLTFPKADSVSAAYFMAGNWQQVISFGNEALGSHIDFPHLRMRMGYAFFSTGNYSGALGQYQKVLANDAGNDTARYYAYVCNKYLNRDAEAYYHAARLDSLTLKSEKLSPFGLVQAGLETGIKNPDNSYRGNAFYSRISLSNRLGYHLVLDQSLAYFNQPITIRETQRQQINTSDAQQEYYGKLTWSVFNKLQIIGAYHYFNTSYQQTTYKNNAGLTAIKYLGSYFDIQADVAFSNINGNNFMQYDSKLTIYPLGNLNLYTISGFTVADATHINYVFSQLLGFKAAKNLWIEGFATFGKLDNYFEYDALYIYNAIDVTTFKAGATLYYQAGKHALLYLNYTDEKKTDAIENINYNQNSITAGITWKF